MTLFRMIFLGSCYGAAGELSPSSFCSGQTEVCVTMMVKTALKVPGSLQCLFLYSLKERLERSLIFVVHIRRFPFGASLCTLATNVGAGKSEMPTDCSPVCVASHPKTFP